MPVIGVSQDYNVKRETFLRRVFGEQTGFLCLAIIPTEPGKKFREEYYQFPDDLPRLLETINRSYPGNNLYFCPQLFKKPQRKKDLVLPVACAWADLDSCAPELMLVEPSLVLETSPNRFQALWIFDSLVDPLEAEELSRKIAYFHADAGADRSGWDLTQLLRMPLTYNYKYASTTDVPIVKIIEVRYSKFRLEDFDAYPAVKTFEYEELPYPEELEDADEVLQRYRLRINPLVWKLVQTEPEGSWSEPLWQLLMLLFEAGMKPDEVLSVAVDSKCNKYARDGKHPKYLWKDVCRALSKYEENSNILVPARHVDQPLLSDEERARVAANPTFVERYIEWAKGLGDAAWQYHQAGAFVALSSILAGPVRLPTSFGTVIPNLWFMILADTTLTRKSTAMDIAMDMVMELDPDTILATDGSLEGLLSTLATRPGRPSIFLRDEFSGLLEMITKKDYYAGMPEMFTKLYDGKMQKRVLRKEVIEVRDPVLILFTGGIKNKITQLLTFEQISSGFIPRFIFITAESDVTKLKPLGPPTERSMGNRDAIKAELADMATHYNKSMTMKYTSGAMIQQSTTTVAELTDDAWVRYNMLEAELVKAGVEHERPDLMTPVYDRLSKSCLKAAVLLAASRQRDEKVVVDEIDIVHAISFVEQWREHVHEVMNNVGKGTAERQYDTIYGAIKRKEGVTRSYLMQSYHLSARDADQIFTTLEQRGLITRMRAGRTEQLFPTRRSDANESGRRL